ncbi:MAG: tryptophan synthase subunit alpha [archaeon]|nr:tryptophan synthase subunit alpha [archaeon]
MNNIDRAFQDLKKKGVKAFIPFFVVGDPNPELFLKIIKEVEPIADIIELGIPYTDPVADGPSIQSANKRAFASGMNLTKAYGLILKVREFTEKPIVILTYANVLGVDQRMDETLSEMGKVGVNGVVVADIPIEESESLVEKAKKNNIHVIFLAAPTTTNERLNIMIERGGGFLYLVSVKGTTGARDTIANETKQTIKRILHGLGEGRSRPICVGFGISKPEHVKEIVSYGVDGTIVGSAISKIIESNLENPSKIPELIGKYVKSMKEQTKIKN